MKTLFIVVCVVLVLIPGGSCIDCNLPPDSGTCLRPSRAKEELRYYYSAKNLKCAEMPYVGCGGNSNNFKTWEECNRKCGRKLPETEMLKAIVKAQAQSRCWFNNRIYGLRESIPEITFANPCRASCACHNDNGRPEIECSVVADCFSPYEEGCVWLRKSDRCCPETYCPGGDQPTPFKCFYKGKDYYEGQAIYPDDYPCMTCYCNKNWTGILTTKGGICQEVNCIIAVDLKDAYHVPQYYTTKQGKQSCCPIQWKREVVGNICAKFPWRSGIPNRSWINEAVVDSIDMWHHSMCGFNY